MKGLGGIILLVWGNINVLNFPDTEFLDSQGPASLMIVCVHRHLAGEVAKEWQELDDAEKAQREPLLTLVKEIVPYNMAHNAEHEACDLLMEIEQVDMLEKDIDENAYSKVCLYLTR